MRCCMHIYENNTIHPTAIIDPSADIGSGNTIGPYVIIEADTVIGNDNVLQSHSIVKQYTSIGNNNTIHSFVALGDVPQDLKFKGEKTQLIIGDNNTFRECATVHRGTAGDHSITKIGNNNLLMTSVHVAHDCILGNSVIMSTGASIAGHVQLNDFCVIGGCSGIHQFCRIGQHAFIAAMSAIGRDVPPYMIASDRRTVATIHGINLIGLRRCGIKKDALAALKDATTLIWKQQCSDRDTCLSTLRAKYPHIEEIHILLDFIQSSKRGILGLTQEEE